MLNLIKKLIKPVCVAGNEGAVADIIAEEAAPYATSVKRDAMGNLIVFVEGSGENKKKLMFAAHTDEVGFMVTHIEEDGYLRFTNVGYVNMTAAALCEVEFENGVVGILVPNGETQTPKYENCFIDIGAKNKKEAEKRVKIGDTFSVKSEVIKLTGSRVAGRPFDDRIGAAVLLEAMKRAERPYNDVYYCFTVQEEVGTRGSLTAAFGVAPDIGIGVDVTKTGDIPEGHKIDVKLGDGAAIKLMDPSVICDRKLNAKMAALAERDKIKYQYEILTLGGTDTASLQQVGSGARAGAISIPSRYIHTPHEVIDLGDVEECVKLAAALTLSDLSDVM